jgi:hypothetical protein
MPRQLTRTTLRTSVALCAAVLLLGGCGSPSQTPATAGTAPVSADAAKPTEPLPDTPDGLGFWINNTPAKKAPVAVDPAAPVEIVVDRFKADSDVRITITGQDLLLPPVSADRQGRVRLTIPTDELPVGFHEIWADGVSDGGGALGITGLLRINGDPIVGEQYSTWLCCLETPASTDISAITLLVNGQDLSLVLASPPSDDGSIRVFLPAVPPADELVIQITDTTTGSTVEERDNTRPDS